MIFKLNQIIQNTYQLSSMLMADSSKLIKQWIQQKDI